MRFFKLYIMIGGSKVRIINKIDEDLQWVQPE